MGTFKSDKASLRFLIPLSICMVYGLFYSNCASSQQDPNSAGGPASSTSIRVQGSVFPPPQVQTTPLCVYSYEDNFYNTDSGTNPPTAASGSYNGNNLVGYFGPTIQLQFNNFNNAYPASQYTVGYSSPTQNTPNVPCDGHYEVSFTVEIRNNSGVGCNMGLNSMSIWSTTTDPASPNAYGCPPSYVDSGGTPHISPSGSTAFVHACATFSQWVQCAWTNNFNLTQESATWNFIDYGVNAFPMFMYTSTWTYKAGNPYKPPYPSDVITYGVYPNMCNPQYPGGCLGYPGNSWLSSYQTAFCTSKTYNFKNVVYLHAGSQISAPALASQMTYTPWDVDLGSWQQCSISVVGGHFKAIYLGP